jgi:hypothetical protein
MAFLMQAELPQGIYMIPLIEVPAQWHFRTDNVVRHKVCHVFCHSCCILQETCQKVIPLTLGLWSCQDSNTYVSNKMCLHVDHRRHVFKQRPGRLLISTHPACGTECRRQLLWQYATCKGRGVRQKEVLARQPSSYAFAGLQSALRNILEAHYIGHWCQLLSGSCPLNCTQLCSHVAWHDQGVSAL